MVADPTDVSSAYDQFDDTDPSLMADENGDAVGGIDQANMYAASGPPSKGALSAAQQVLSGSAKAKEGFANEYQSVRDQQQARADYARDTLRKAREAIVQKKHNDSAMWFNLAAAFGSPTRTGGFGESLGYAAKAASQGAQEREAWDTDREKQLSGYDAALSNYGTGPHAVDANMLATQLQQLQLKQRLQSQLEQRALTTVGRAGSTTGLLPIEKTLAALGIQPGTPEYTRALNQYKQKLTHLPADPNAPVNLTPDDIEVAKKVGMYHMDPAKALARVSGEKRQAMQSYIWSNVNPDYSDYRYGVTRQAMMQFGSNKDADPGGKMIRFGTAVSHLDTVRELAMALNNGDIGWVNKAKNAFAQETGKPAPTNLQGAIEIVMPELEAAIVAGGGTGAERAELKSLPNLSRSPKQFADLIDKVWLPLMAGKLDNLRTGFYSSVENDAGLNGWFERKLSKHTREVMRNHGFDLHPVDDETPDIVAPKTGDRVVHPDVAKRAQGYLNAAQSGGQ
jgi:hypothetical protein